MLDTFQTVWSLRYPGLNCYLVADGLKCHLNARVVLKMAQKNVFCVFFGPHCTHFAQPLDGYMFGTMKTQFKIRVAELAVGGCEEETGGASVVFIALFEAILIGFTPQIIAACFRDRFLWPYNRVELLKLGEEWVGNKRNLAARESTDRVNALVDRTLEARRASFIDRVDEFSTVRARVPKRTPKLYHEVLELAERNTREKLAAEEEKRQRKEERIRIRDEK